MDICEKYLEDAYRALKSSMLSKPDPMEAVRCFEGAGICFENSRNFSRAAQCYAETTRLISKIDPSKAAEMHEKAAQCLEKVGGPASEHYLQAAGLFREIAIQKYRENPEQGLQLLQKAAEDFEKGGDKDMAVQCYDVGAEASLQRNDYQNAIVFYGAAARSFERRKEFKKSLNYYHKVARLWDTLNIPENVAENYWRMATSLETMKEYGYSTQLFSMAADKYEQAQQAYKASKSYEKAGETLSLQERFAEAAQAYRKSAEIVKSLRNMDKYEELIERAAESHVKAGEVQKAVETYMALAQVFSEDPYRCSAHFEKAVSLAEGDASLKVELLQKQGEVLMEVHDYTKAGKSYMEAAELYEKLGRPSPDLYTKAGNAFLLFAHGMQRVKNELKAKEGFEMASLCFGKAGAREEVEKLQQQLKPVTGEREGQIREELARLKADVEKGILPENYYNQIKDGYSELLKRLKK